MNKTIRIAATLITLFALSACAGQQQKKPPAPRGSWLSGLSKILPKKKPSPPVATPVNWAGTIRMVNKSENFALIETESAAPCVVGEKYISVQNGRESGTLLITSLKAHPFIIADIAGGEPSDGDKIYLPRQKWSEEPRSAPDLPSAETLPAPLPE